MPMFRNKPVTIEARQVPDWLNERASPESAKALSEIMVELVKWCGGAASRDALGPCIEIDTLEGTMLARPGDWIIKGVKGEFCPIKSEIFAATYEAVQP